MTKLCLWCSPPVLSMSLAQSPSMLSLRGPELDEKPARGGGKLPPIVQEEESADRLFQSRRDAARRPDDDDLRSESRLSLSSAER